MKRFLFAVSYSNFRVLPILLIIVVGVLLYRFCIKKRKPEMTLKKLFHNMPVIPLVFIVLSFILVICDLFYADSYHELKEIVFSNPILNWGNIAVLFLGGSVWLWFQKEYKIKKSEQLINSLPGIFTSLGLLFTFVSICWSLNNVKPNLSTKSKEGQTVSEVNDVKVEITDIVGKLIPAFTSSICGLIMALFVTIVNKKQFSDDEYLLGNKLKNKSPEENIYSIVNLLEEQKNASKLYNDKLNTNISKQSEILEKFINDFVDRMDVVFNNMKESVESQINNFGEEQFRKSSVVITDLAEKMSSISEDILKQQNNSVQKMVEGTNQELKVVSDTVINQISQLSAGNASALQMMSSRQNQELSRINEQIINKFNEIKDAGTDNVERMTDLKDSYQNLSENMLRSSTEMNQQVSNELRSSLSAFIDKLQTSVTDCVNNLKDSYCFIDQHIAEIKSNYEQSALAFDNAVTLAHRTNDAADKVIEQVNKSLCGVAVTNGKIENVLDILDKRQENIQYLIHGIKDMGDTIVTLQNLQDILNKRLN